MARVLGAEATAAVDEAAVEVREAREVKDAEEAKAAAVWEARMESGKLVCVAVKVDCAVPKVGSVPFTTIIKKNV